MTRSKKGGPKAALFNSTSRDPVGAATSRPSSSCPAHLQLPQGALRRRWKKPRRPLAAVPSSGASDAPRSLQRSALARSRTGQGLLRQQLQERPRLQQLLLLPPVRQPSSGYAACASAFRQLPLRQLALLRPVHQRSLPPVLRLRWPSACERAACASAFLPELLPPL